MVTVGKVFETFFNVENTFGQYIQLNVVAIIESALMTPHFLKPVGNSIARQE